MYRTKNRKLQKYKVNKAMNDVKGVKYVNQDENV